MGSGSRSRHKPQTKHIQLHGVAAPKVKSKPAKVRWVHVSGHNHDMQQACLAAKCTYAQLSLQ